MAQSLEFLDAVLIIPWDFFGYIGLKSINTNVKNVPTNASFYGTKQIIKNRDSYR